MKTSVLKPFGARAVAIIILIPAFIFPATDSLVTSMETYFSDLKDEVNRCGATSIVKNAAGVQLRGYFGAVMKKNPSIRSLMKTDARGKVLCERIRGKNRPHERRSVAQYGWFSQTAKSLREYDCVITDENGRAALSWSVPLLRGGAARRFYGAFIAVIDSRNCFRAIAKAGAPPFLVRLDEKNFYGHSWNNSMIFIESPIAVPGADNMTVRYQNSNVSVFVQPESTRTLSPDTPRQASIAAPKDSAAATDSAPPATAKKNIPLIIALAALIVVVAVLLIIQIKGGIPRRRGATREKRDFL